MLHNATRPLRWLPWLLAVAVSSVSGQQRSPVAHVLDVKGAWHLAHQDTLVQAGQALFAGTDLTTQWYDYGSSITIVRDEDLSRQRVACENTPSNPCRKPILVSANSAQPPAGLQGQLKGLVNTALSLLLDKPPSIASHYALTLSRGQHSISEVEDLLAFDARDNTSLSQTLPGLPAGQYSFLIAPSGQTVPPVSRRVAISSDGRWEGLQFAVPGLYTVSVIDSGGERLVELMLLLVPQPQFSVKRKAFEAAKACSAQWEGEGARSDEHLFLRAVLLSASRSS